MFDTIAAISTPRGKGGIAVIRVSGAEAAQIAGRVWLLSPDGLTEGTPSQLAAEGALERFFRCEGLEFDRSHLRFTLK